MIIFDAIDGRGTSRSGHEIWFCPSMPWKEGDGTDMCELKPLTDRLIARNVTTGMEKERINPRGFGSRRIIEISGILYITTISVIYTKGPLPWHCSGWFTLHNLVKGPQEIEICLFSRAGRKASPSSVNDQPQLATDKCKSPSPRVSKYEYRDAFVIDCFPSASHSNDSIYVKTKWRPHSVLPSSKHPSQP